MIKEFFGKKKTAKTRGLDEIFSDPRYVKEAGDTLAIVERAEANSSDSEFSPELLTLALEPTLLDSWNDAVGCDDFTDHDLEIWMEAFIPTIAGLNGGPAEPVHVKMITEKAKRQEMGQEKMFVFLDTLNGLLEKNGFLK